MIIITLMRIRHLPRPTFSWNQIKFVQIFHLGLVNHRVKGKKNAFNRKENVFKKTVFSLFGIANLSKGIKKLF